MAVLAAIHDPADLARCTATCRLLRSAADQLIKLGTHQDDSGGLAPFLPEE